MEYLKPIFIKKYLSILFLFIGFFVIFPIHDSIYGQYTPCDNSGITATLTYPYNGNNTQALVNRSGGRGNEGIAVWREGDPKPGYSGNDPYLATGLLCGTRYLYEAYTRNSCAGSDVFGGFFDTVSCAPPLLAPPTGQNYTCNPDSTLTVRWDAVAGASGYIARLDYQGSMSGAVIYDWQNLALNDQVAQPTLINHTFAITYGTRYQWAVSTKNSANVGGAWSWNSPTLSCNAPSYPVTYNGNGNTGGSIPAAQTKIQNVNLTLRVNTGFLTRTGYTFTGWNTAANGTGTNYAAGGTYAANQAATMYAQWTLNTYQITYSGNGNTGGSIPAAQTKTQNVNLTLRTNSGNLTRTGYTFAGWNTVANGTGSNYAAGATYGSNQAATMYAQWTINTYTITYNGNINTSGAVPAAQTKTYNVNLTLRTNSGNLTRTGYTFAGWSTTTDGSSGNYAAGGTYSANVGDVLYARWTPNTYAVTYNGNGNTGGSIPAAQTKTYAVILILRTNSGNLSRTGYTFAGWNTAANGTGTNYVAGGGYITDQVATMYARWTPNTYAVTYNGNGNTGGSIPAAQTKTQDVNLTLRTNTGTLTRTGYTFAGWDTAANGSGTNYAAGGTYAANATAVMYAQWTPNTYAVTYNGNGNTGGSIPAAQTKTQDVNLTLRTNTGTLTRTGYTFAGWDTAANGSGTNYAAGGTYAANATTVMYAQWTPNTYAVTYNGNGNTGGSIPAAQTKTQDVNLTLRTNTGTLTRTGYTFAGWDTAANGSGTNYAAGGTYAANATAVMYAQWTINTYTVTGTAGSNGIITPGTRTVNYNTTTTFTITPNTGYSASASGCGGSLSGTTFTTGAITGNCTVTATFTIISYTLTKAANPATGGTFECSTTSPSSGFGPCAATYTHGTTVYVRANPTATYTFSSFAAGHGCATVASNVCTYAMTAIRSITANFTLLPDLVPSTITRSTTPDNYTIRYCNTGPGTTAITFSMTVTNSLANPSTSTTVTGLAVPAAGGACLTRNIPCSALGDTYGGINCNESSSIVVMVDTTNTITEFPPLGETNNTSAATNFSAVVAEPFYKVSNASLHRLRAIDIQIPAGLQAYDVADDTTDTYLDVKTAGLVTSSNTIRVLSGTVSANNIQKDTYTDSNTYLNALSTFTNYATAQKQTKTIATIAELQSNTINVYTGALPLVISSIPAGITDFVLLVNGNVTINQAPTFNTVADNSVAIISTGTITIDPTVTTVNAIIIGSTVNLGISNANRLKINGNLISNTTTTQTRNVPATTRPNLFVVFNPKMYIDLLPQMSDITIEGRQVE